jgi:pimeloyl-ACP methyl ester carboxylesterase
MKVFVHGNPETAAIWRPLVAELAVRGETHVLLLSPPGFGVPTPEGWDASHTSYRDWLIHELEAIGGEIDLVGHDWGAGHVYNVLAERPDLVRSWAADCAGLVHPDYVWHDAAQAWQTPEVGEQFVAGMVDAPVEARAGIFTSVGVAKAEAEEIAGAMDAEMGRCILALYRSAAQPAMRELGDRLRTTALPPGHVIIASDDPYVGSIEMAEEVAASLGAGKTILEGAGHWWMLERPAYAVDALTAFWAGLDA